MQLGDVGGEERKLRSCRIKERFPFIIPMDLNVKLEVTIAAKIASQESNGQDTYLGT
jgi:hypothetical protein